MSISLEKTSKAYELLKNYNGPNSYLIDLKNDIFVYKKGTLNDFQIEYILNNHDFEPIYLNKIIKIAKWFGEKKQSDWNIEFVPEKLLVGYYLGETETTYHMYVRYRRTQPKMIPIFIPKKALLNPLFLKDFNQMEVDFAKYNQMGNIILKPHQEEGVKFLLTRKKCILAHQMGGGKEIDVNTPIPTPNGWVKADDVQVGDFLFASNGKPTKVLGKYYQGEKDIYEITFSDATTVNCGLDHLWIVKRFKKDWEVKSLRELLEIGLHPNLTKQQIEHGRPPGNMWQIPMCQPVEYEPKDYFIDPYVLGMLIGDGNLCNNAVHISIPHHESETIDRISNLLHEGYTLSFHKGGVCPRYSVVRAENRHGYKNDYIQEIKRLGLNVIGHEKFIPQEYMLGSIEQRLALLQGLMDSDGYISSSKNKIDFTSTSLRLVLDVKLLVESLGGRCTSIYEDKRGDKYKTSCYKLRIQIRMNPFRLTHKASRYTITDENVKYCHRYIKDVKLVRKAEAVCFAVDSEDHSFLTEHYVVTHNTITAIVGALEGDFQKILVICPASVKPTWFREINRFLPEDEITIVEGSTWKENRFTIINYDILDNFYEIPVETVKRRVRYVDDMGNIKYKYEEKEVVSKKGAVIKEAMANSQLFQMEFDCVIIDEAHRLSNANSGRYKIISDLLKRSQPNYIWELTGTMITNNPMNLYNILKIIDAEITNDWVNYVKTYCDGKQIFVKGERDKLTYGYLKKCGVSSWYDLNQNQKAYLNQYLEDNCKKIWLTSGSSNLDELKERIKHLYLRDLNEDIYKNFSKETIVLSYDLTNEEKEYYDQVWEQYVAEHADEETDITKLITNKKLIESSVLRQATSQMMVPHTIKLAEEIIEKGEKVIIFCAFDKEIYALQEHFGDKCVVHNGKITAKNKEKVLSAFTNDENVTVFLGNLVSSSVGLTLTAANNIIFNSVSWLPAENQQAEYRILRIGQTRDCKIFYQKFANTYHEKMFEILDIKNEIIDSVIVDETQK